MFIVKMASLEMENILSQLNTLTRKPTKYLTVQKDIKEDIKEFIKSLYDYTKAQENKTKVKNSSLPQLIIEDFNEEQIWQEIELQNNECYEQWVRDVANSVSEKNNLTFPVELSTEDNNSTIESDHYSQSEDDSSLLEPEDDQMEDETGKVKKTKAKLKQSVVDDKFFKLEEMEKFLLKEEKQEKQKNPDDSDEESIDMFEEIDDEESGEEGGKDMMYFDFFNDEDHDLDNKMESKSNSKVATKVSDNDLYKKSVKKVTFVDDMSVDDEESSSDNDSDTSKTKLSQKSPNNVEKKSEFELRQQRLEQQVGKLEEKTLKEAPWQLKGEVDALKRPHNSLLEEVVDFDLTSRPPPIITEQTTITLEELIKRRIKDKAWDDVIKKQKAVDDQLAFRKPEVIDQSKSKLSLAQVYEAEYLKQKQLRSGETEEEKEPESHKEIREAMSNLFSKLDALCHYHYTPKPPQAEVKIVTNTPAISMEEVAPIATSDANLLAPEEIKKKRRGDLMSKDERTQTDKNRERRKKKKLQRSKGKVVKVTEQRNTKKGIEASDKSLKTSKAFFQQLNDDSSGLIKSKKSRTVKNK